MGIKGLTTFIDRNPHVLHTHELKNCSVIIDGNNFYHYLYYACHVNCSLGGDYDTYRRKVISTFKAFEKCGVIPYVVLDGAYTVDDRKLRTSLYRASMRNTLVSVMARFGRGQVLPILAYDTFMQVLSELGINHVTCQFEADVEIAVLANRFKCPVISNDSDFYIFDLEGGFLPLDYVDFRPLCRQDDLENADPSSWYLHTQIYHVDDFISAFKGLSRPVLPVFACLLGNDYIKASSFDSFYRRIQVPKIVSKKYDLPPRLSKIISVIHWFHIHSKDWSTLLQEILSFLHPQSKGNLRKLFLTSINSYINLSKFDGPDLQSYFKQGKNNYNPVAGRGFTGYNGTPFPKWFLNSICRGEITPSTINVAVLHRLILLSQVEDLSQETSYMCSLHIRKVLYGILFNSDPVGRRTPSRLNFSEDESNLIEAYSLIFKSSLKKVPDAENEERDSQISLTDVSDEDGDGKEENDEHEEEVASLLSSENQSKAVKKQTQLEEYNRVKRHIQRFYVDPRHQAVTIALPCLSDIEELALETRLSVLLSALDVKQSFFDRFSNDISLFLSVLLVWVKNASPKISEQHVDCVILCLIYLSVYDKLSCKMYKNEEIIQELNGESQNSPPNHCETENMKEPDFPSISLYQVLRTLPHDQIQKIHQTMSKHHKNAPTFNHKNHFEPETIHPFAQLQACILDTSNLNKLLCFPMPNLRPACLMNGTFLYNMYNDVISRPDPDAYIGALLVTESPVHKIFLSIKSVLQEYLPQNVYREPSLKNKKRSRKRKAKNKSSQAMPEKDDESDNKPSDDEEEKEISGISGFDVANKFSFLLSLDS